MATRADLRAQSTPKSCEDVEVSIVGGCGGYYESITSSVKSTQGGARLCFDAGGINPVLMEAERMVRAYFARFGSVSKAIANLDTNDNGAVSYDEMLEAATPARIAFDLIEEFDADKSGELEVSEFTMLSEKSATSNATHLGFDSMIRRLSKCAAEPPIFCSCMLVGSQGWSLCSAAVSPSAPPAIPEPSPPVPPPPASSLSLSPSPPSPLASPLAAHNGSHLKNDAFNPCFPSSALATLANGSATRLDALRPGDAIVAATASGHLTTGRLSFISIAQPEATSRLFVTLTTGAGQTLTVTAEHHLPVGGACCTALKTAREIEVGETIWIAGASAAEIEPPVVRLLAGKGLAGSAAAALVAQKGEALGDGLHSPVITAGHFPVIDGVVTAFDAIGKVTLASYGLPLLEAACTATGTCALVRSALFAG